MLRLKTIRQKAPDIVDRVVLPPSEQRMDEWEKSRMEAKLGFPPFPIGE
jgi:hypothetical protein